MPAIKPQQFIVHVLLLLCGQVNYLASETCTYLQERAGVFLLLSVNESGLDPYPPG